MSSHSLLTQHAQYATLTSNWICLRIVFWNTFSVCIIGWRRILSIDWNSWVNLASPSGRSRNSFANKTESHWPLEHALKVRVLICLKQFLSLFLRRLSKVDSFFLDFHWFYASFEFILSIVSDACIWWPVCWFHFSMHLKERILTLDLYIQVLEL